MFDTILRKQSIQDLKKLISDQTNEWIKNTGEFSQKEYSTYLMILFHYGITPEDIIDLKKNIINLNAIIYNDKSADPKTK